MRGSEIVDGLLAAGHEDDALVLRENPRTERFDGLMSGANTLMGLPPKELEERSVRLHRFCLLLEPRCDPEVAARALWIFVSMGLNVTDAVNCALREAQVRAELRPDVGEGRVA